MPIFHKPGRPYYQQKAKNISTALKNAKFLKPGYFSEEERHKSSDYYINRKIDFLANHLEELSENGTTTLLKEKITYKGENGFYRLLRDIKEASSPTLSKEIKQKSYVYPELDISLSPYILDIIFKGCDIQINETNRVKTAKLNFAKNDYSQIAKEIAKIIENQDSLNVSSDLNDCMEKIPPSFNIFRRTIELERKEMQLFHLVKKIISSKKLDKKKKERVLKKYGELSFLSWTSHFFIKLVLLAGGAAFLVPSAITLNHHPYKAIDLFSATVGAFCFVALLTIFFITAVCKFSPSASSSMNHRFSQEHQEAEKIFNSL